ncbi:MAG: glycosyltransferase family 4 protein [Clostridia bacterium]|nr:glycosyltransferase family 4 protein [Clostridia bacterium]
MDITAYRKIEFEEREKRLKNAKFQNLVKTEKIKDKLDIVYVMTWTELCGGSKIILEHSNYLVQRGHKVTIISHFPKPNWFYMDDRIIFIKVPWKEILCKVIHPCDIIIATYWREIYECIEQEKAPVVYFEQGDSHLFDLETLDERTLNYIKKEFEVVPFIFTVSSYASQKIKEIYNRDSIIIPNAVNDESFYSLDVNKNKDDKAEVSIAMIGSEKSEFKRIKIILNAIEGLRKEGYSINVNWITPDEPENSKEKFLVNPTQKEIGEALRKSDIYICASKYESFGLPTLEAMKCGLAIITTDTGGNKDFVIDNENALITTGTVEDIKVKIKILISNNKLRRKLSKNSRITSMRYNWKNIIDELEEYYTQIAKYEIV